MDWLETAVLWAVPVVLAITLHEAAHGYVARIFGDQTAWMLGRVTLNPLKHIDPIGTVLVPGVLFLMHAPFLFGWAKPVPVNFGNLRHPKRDMVWVAGAGPLANFVMALAWAVLLGLTAPSGPWTSDGLFEMADAGVKINLALLALNLLPVPPLDGGRIAVGLLPQRASALLARAEPYGFFVILILIAIPGALWTVLGPIYRMFATLVYALSGV
ncbi:MAG TPA: site-2 protease family protein [Casimicrobiaceae bacterium]|nr:site-2 protease family protein [Casimicrobiaceae bacterium]